MIYKLLEGKDTDWDLYLPSTQLFINLKVSETTGSTPYSLMYARSAHGFLTTATEQKELDLEIIRTRLEEMTEVVYPAIRRKTDTVLQKRNQMFARTHQILKEPFPDGTKVMCLDENRKGKSEPRYEGPFTIQRRNQAGVYVLKGVDGSEYTRPGHTLKIVHPDIVEPTPDESVGVVKRILGDTRNTKGEALYLVQWEGTNKQSWVHNQDFHDHGPIRTYWKQRDNGKAPARRKRLDSTIIEETSADPLDSHSASRVATIEQHNGVREQTKLLPSEEYPVSLMESSMDPQDKRLPKELRSDLAGYFKIPESGKRKRSDQSYRE